MVETAYLAIMPAVWIGPLKPAGRGDGYRPYGSQQTHGAPTANSSRLGFLDQPLGGRLGFGH
jgi:hypothetical protein